MFPIEIQNKTLDICRICQSISFFLCLFILFFFHFNWAANNNLFVTFSFALKFNYFFSHFFFKFPISSSLLSIFLFFFLQLRINHQLLFIKFHQISFSHFQHVFKKNIFSIWQFSMNQQTIFIFKNFSFPHISPPSSFLVLFLLLLLLHRPLLFLVFVFSFNFNFKLNWSVITKKYQCTLRISISMYLFIYMGVYVVFRCVCVYLKCSNYGYQQNKENVLLGKGNWNKTEMLISSFSNR